MNQTYVWKNVLFRGLWQNTCQWVSVRSHMWLRFCHWASKHLHICRNVATYLPLGLPASTVTQSRCWPVVNVSVIKMWQKRCQWASSAPYVLPASILPLGPKGLTYLYNINKQRPMQHLWYSVMWPVNLCSLNGNVLHGFIDVFDWFHRTCPPILRGRHYAVFFCVYLVFHRWGGTGLPIV